MKANDGRLHVDDDQDVEKKDPSGIEADFEHGALGEALVVENLVLDQGKEGEDEEELVVFGEEVGDFGLQKALQADPEVSVGDFFDENPKINVRKQGVSCAENNQDEDEVGH